jgi:hypothetical protein
MRSCLLSGRRRDCSGEEISLCRAHIRRSKLPSCRPHSGKSQGANIQAGGSVRFFLSASLRLNQSVDLCDLAVNCDLVDSLIFNGRFVKSQLCLYIIRVN